MDQDKSLQKDEMYLPGDLGNIGSQPITEIFKSKDGAVIITIGPPVDKIVIEQCPVAHLAEQPSCELAGRGFESLPDNQNLLT